MADVQSCNRCGEYKPLSDFTRYKTWLRKQCNECRLAYQRLYRKRNEVRERPARVYERGRRRERPERKTKEYRERANRRRRENYAADPQMRARESLRRKDKWSSEKEKARKAADRAKNRHRCSAASAAYRAALLRAMPRWVDNNAIKAVYLMAAIMDGDFHVDHIVPLQSLIVCGLHVPWNLQIITASRNKAKRNWRWPDMPERRKDWR